MSAPELTACLSTDPEADRRIIWEQLVAFNRARMGPSVHEPFTVALKDAAGETVGGAYGAIFFSWLHVEMLVVPEERRGEGHGRRLLQRIETLARSAGCIGIWLDTYAFQAPGFYAKAGFTQIGSIPDLPPGSRRFFLAKRFD